MLIQILPPLTTQVSFKLVSSMYGPATPITSLSLSSNTFGFSGNSVKEKDNFNYLVLHAFFKYYLLKVPSIMSIDMTDKIATIIKPLPFKIYSISS